MPQERTQTKQDIETYQTLKDEQEAALSGKGIEGKVSLEAYKRSVIEQIGAELGSGAAVETHVTQHFVRLQALHEDHVVIDDPGQSSRANKKVLWDEARAQALFDKRLVIR